eukprot:m.253521 g.253521  ORF g.253521 m.253521 type:complete len:95 (+) comp40370_c0_seq57:1157-1441(+)
MGRSDTSFLCLSFFGRVIHHTIEWSWSDLLDEGIERMASAGAEKLPFHLIQKCHTSLPFLQTYEGFSMTKSGGDQNFFLRLRCHVLYLFFPIME